MESTIQIEIDVVNKRVRAVDVTDYTFAPASLAAKGLGTIRFDGTILLQKLTTVDPLINLGAGSTTSVWVDAPLDSNGDVAYGTYTITDYSVNVSLVNDTANGVTAGSGGAGGFTLNGLVLSDVLADGDSITISSSLAGNNGVKTVASVTVASGNSTIFVDETVNAEIVPSSNVSFDLTKPTASITAVYAGCTQITPSFSFQSDCDYGLYGRLSVLDTTELNGQTLVSRLLTLKYPRWKDTADLTSTDGGIVLDALSTGTWTVINAYTISNVTGSLVVTYTASVRDEKKVSCAGTLCGLLPCIQNLWNSHKLALQGGGVSPYQYFVDGILLNYTQAIEYKKCGEYDKYLEKVAAIDELLDASGCECSCCDDDVLVDVVNATADQASVIQDLQDQIDAIDAEITALTTTVNNIEAAQETQASAITVIQENVTDLQELVIFTKMGVINQSGSSAPTYVSSFETDLNTMTFSRLAAGSYRITFGTAFDISKVFPYIDTQDFTKGVTIYVESTTQIRILTYDLATFVLQDNVLLNSKLRIDFVQ